MTAMTDASFASLNPSLLARKGGAKPAMRPQIAPLDSMGPQVSSNLEDLGWNDMGEDQDDASKRSKLLALTPEPVNEEAEVKAREVDQVAQEALKAPNQPLVRKQQEGLAERLSNPVSKRDASPVTPSRRSALGRGKRAAFTLRLDADRHLKLRLASTVKGRSAQQIVTEALDQLLDDMPELSSLAAQVQQR